jgi:hypothetical protein
MRPDRVTTALRAWIEEMMGKEYVFQKPFDMAVRDRVRILLISSVVKTSSSSY